MARALEVAARRWPGEPRSTLLLRLIRAGGDTLEEAHRAMIRTRQEAIASSSGKYADAFSDDYLSELRQDWPA